MAEKPMRIVLGDELTLVRGAIRRLLESMSEPRVQVLGETGDGQALLEMAARFRPDLVIVEHTMTSMGGQEVGQQLRRHYPDVKLMFLTARSEPNPVRLAMQSGAVAYVVKDAEPLELELALKAIAKGQSYLSPKVSAAAFDRRVRARDERQGVLSQRQRQVLRLMARGKSTKEIAALMGVSVKTVETHRARMAAILGLYGINPLMRFAIKMGMDNGEL